MLASAALLASAAQAATPAVVITQRTLSLDGANLIANAAVAECRQRGFKVSVAVLDAAGQPLVLLHDDGAPPHTTENADRKAYTALTTRGPSADFGKRIASNATAVGVLQLARITSLEGGLPVKAGSDVIGAVGVSGAPTGAEDILCVNAGLAKIAPQLAR